MTSMQANPTRSIGLVEVSIITSPDEQQWTVRTRWLNPNGTEMTRGTKTFTGADSWIDAIAFANSILWDEWKRDPSRERPYFDA